MLSKATLLVKGDFPKALPFPASEDEYDKQKAYQDDNAYCDGDSPNSRRTFRIRIHENSDIDRLLGLYVLGVQTSIARERLGFLEAVELQRINGTSPASPL